MGAKNGKIVTNCFEYGVPALLTLVWCISLAIIAFDVISYPEDQAHKIAVGVAVALVLFFVEMSVYCIDFGYTQLNKNINSKTFFLIAGMTFAMAIFAVLELSFFNKSANWLLIVLAIMCVGVPKWISCELSRNPHHYTNERRSAGTFQEKQPSPDSPFIDNNLKSVPDKLQK